MKGKELIEWIKENHAEEHVVIAVDENRRYMWAKELWEGESDGGAIMIEVDEDRVKMDD